MARFRRGRGGLVSIDLDPVEVDVLGSLVREVVELLDVPPPQPTGGMDPLQVQLGLQDLGTGGHEGPASAPEDPALRRLLPDAYPDDPQAAAEFRRFTERSLRERKAEAGRRMLVSLEPVQGQGGRVQLDADGARAWLAALNDIRLALGTRLGVDEDVEEVLADLDDDDPRRYAFAVYDFATYLQETLVRSMP
ncbi:uncharacterized protein DUF2017 [Kineococcus xinjiangensis]|uniref:Uncharacterized protein DUF2017 n=1 Tax=Kineococcus xinjiangensis TaxID=512762 RepID=A0A2S6ICS8_9ACTN|nr:DUF2017 domain-containing protein [Kineococcus xinjiangensis]PPK91997.1 uncharacterized protein DUF2017 [Kineococcus xinjiangensis]